MGILDFLKKLRSQQTEKEILSDSYLTFSKTDDRKHVSVTSTTSPDSVHIFLEPDKFLNDFFNLSEIIENGKDIYQKLGLSQRLCKPLN